MQGGGLQLGGGLGQGGLRLGGLNQGQQSTGMGLQTGGILGQQSQAGTGTGLSFGMGLGQQNTGAYTGGLGGGGLKFGGGLAGGGLAGGGLAGGGLGVGGLAGGGLGVGGLAGGGLGGGLAGGGLGGGLAGGGLAGGGLGGTTGLGGLNLAGIKPAGAVVGGGGMFSNGNQQQQQQQQAVLIQQATQAQLMLNSVKAPNVFGDERDLILVKFNLLQAYCGSGKGLASLPGQPAQAVNFTAENPFCRFKTVCYSHLPSSRNEDGLVVLQFKKPDSQLLSQQDSLAKALQALITTPSVQLVVDSVRPLPDNCSEMTVYVLERSVMGSTRHLLAADVFMFLQNATRKAELEKLGVVGLYPKTGFNEEHLKLYLENPPAGITAQMWAQAKLDNPNPQKLLPVPVLGSAALLKRMKHQQQESKQHLSRLQIIEEEAGELQRAHSTTVARLAEHRRKLLALAHRLLRAMVAMETLRKSGYSIQPQEEQLRIRLEGVQTELDAPLQFKGRLNELMSQLRMQTQVPGARLSSYALEPMLLEEIRQHLQQQQGALSQLVKVVKEDFEDLKCIEEGFTQT